LQKDKFAITMNRARLLADAKAKALELADEGYVQPAPRNDIKVLGNQGLGIVYVGLHRCVKVIISLIMIVRSQKN
jgi:3-hydroxyacyl-CoA dehydrogenase